MNSATQSFLGRYRLVKVLGQGAMGVVYEAVDTRLNRTVAIKTVLRSHLADETTANEYATRFEREAQAAARLTHPHVVTVFDFGEHEDISYIVMEFIRGRELNQAFEAGQHFPLSEAIRIMRELLSALDYAHKQGIVHRDIKPANVMLDPAGRVKLTDFGVARVANANQDRTMPGTLVGTPSYMSPEQILGLAVGSRADIFATGVILYQFLTGRRPFTGGGPFGVQRKIVQDDPEPPSKVNPDLPEGFDLIIARALAKQPENRYENAGAFAADLERIGASLPRDVPLIDLDLPDDAAAPDAAPAPASAPAPVSRTPPPAAAPPPADPAGLTLITAVPFGSPAPPAEPDAPPFDPEATVIMFRPSAPDPTATRPPIPVATVPMGPPAPPTTRTGTVSGRSATSSTPVRPTPSAPPPPAAAPAPRSAPAPAPTPPPANAPTVRPALARSDTPRRPATTGYAGKRTLMPLAAGAGVAVLALTAWLLVARPWAAKPPPAGYPVTPTVTTPAPTPSPAPSTSQATPAASPTMPAAPVVDTAPAVAPAPPPPAPTRAKPADNAAKPAPAPRTEPRSSGIEPRCSDLLQRMQLGEPLSTEQTAYFQTRCTR